jgi:hypothetical protein
MDDVLNLRGFRYGLKSLGEDISHGKVTMRRQPCRGCLKQNDAGCGRPFRPSRPTRTVSAVIGN